MDDILAGDLREEYEQLSADGFRVLALAYKDFSGGQKKAAYSKADECDLVLKGYVAFLDPPKDSAGRRHRRPARPRRAGQGAHRRQRAGHAEDLPGGRPGGPPGGAGLRRASG